MQSSLDTICVSKCIDVWNQQIATLILGPTGVLWEQTIQMTIETGDSPSLVLWDLTFRKFKVHFLHTLNLLLLELLWILLIL